MPKKDFLFVLIFIILLGIITIQVKGG